MRESTAARSLTSSVRDLLAAVTGPGTNVRGAFGLRPGVAVDIGKIAVKEINHNGDEALRVIAIAV